MSFEYEVRRAEDGELLATGRSKHISVDTNGQVTRLPPTLREVIEGETEPQPR
jgi:acyl-CoA thioesterase FadM